MKYYNNTTNEWYLHGKSITRRLEDGSVFSGIPTESQLLSWGFEEYIDIAPTQEELLNDAIRNKVELLEMYDASANINQFTYNNIPMWLDKSTRVGLLLRITAEKETGNTTTTLWFDTHSFEIPIADAFQMLYAIELYASQCYDRTSAHKATIEALNTVSDVEAYDFTTGYPEKLNFGTNN